MAKKKRRLFTRSIMQDGVPKVSILLKDGILQKDVTVASNGYRINHLQCRRCGVKYSHDYSGWRGVYKHIKHLHPEVIALYTLQGWDTHDDLNDGG